MSYSLHITVELDEEDPQDAVHEGFVLVDRFNVITRKPLRIKYSVCDDDDGTVIIKGGTF